MLVFQRWRRSLLLLIYNLIFLYILQNHLILSIPVLKLVKTLLDNESSIGQGPKRSLAVKVLLNFSLTFIPALELPLKNVNLFLVGQYQAFLYISDKNSVTDK